MAIETLEKPLAYQCEERPRSLVEHFWEIQPTDLEGKPTGLLRVVKGHSWLRNMAAMMRTRLSQTDTNGFRTSGAAAAMTNSVASVKSWSLQLLALPFGVGVSGRGILLGSGAATPENTNDFNLSGTLSNGVGAGNLLFQNDVMNALETIGGGFRIFHEKLFLNQSGAVINITNVGWVGFCNFVPSSTIFLITRDNIAFSIPNLSGVIVKFREDWTV